MSPASSQPEAPPWVGDAAGTPPTRLTLFGVPRVLHRGRELPLPVRKTLALLVYLSLEGRSSRARLAELLWDELDEATARRNLRRTLHRLRTAGLGESLVADDDSVVLTGVENDLEVFERAVGRGRIDEALALRTGELCEGMEIEQASGFSEWLRQRRDRFGREWRSTVELHARTLEKEGNLRDALRAQRQLLDDDPLQEATFRELMRLHDALGERAAALELFDRCEQTLRQELQLEPLPQTKLLAERIRSRQQALATVGEKDAPIAPAALETGGGLAAVPLVARERELATLATLAHGVVLIEGDAGVGKSRLALESWRRAAGDVDPETEPPVVLVRFTELSSSTPFHALTDALRAPAVAGRLAGLAATWRRDLARLLPELQADDDSATAADAMPEEARTRLLEALAQALAAASAPSRQILFDDLQWADASSIELLSHLARRRRQDPASMTRVLATARGAELFDNSAASVALQAIEKGGDLARLTLGAFDDWSMLQLVQRLSGSEGGIRFAARLGAATGGNVFFALETIRALLESGELRAEPDRGWSTRYDSTTTDYAEMPLPASVVDAVLARVARLGPAAQRVLETAALAEDGSTLAEIQGATALSDWEALAGLERAIVAHLIDRVGDGYRFVHALIRASIRSGLSAERQRLIHAKLAAALQPTGADPARIAAHWEAAGQAKAAVIAWVAAAKAATAVHAHLDAAAHYAKAAALETDRRRAYEWHDLRIDRLLSVGLMDSRESVLATMQQVASELGDSGLGFRTLSRAAEVAMRKGELLLSEQLAQRALTEYEPPEPRWHVHALNGTAFAALRLDRHAQAAERYLEARAVALAAGIADYAGAMAGFAATAFTLLGRTAEALELRDEALAAAQPDTVLYAQILNNSAIPLRAVRRRGEAIAQYRQAAEIAGRRRNPGYGVIYQANLCEILLDDGQPEAARDAHRACVEAAGQAVECASYFAALTGSRVLASEGRLGEAIEAAEAALGEAIETLDRREVSAILGLLLWRIGALPEARLRADACDAMPSFAAPRQALLSVVLRAAVDVDAAAAAIRLRAALADPLSDRLLHDDIDLANVMLGGLACAAGDATAAMAAVEGVGYGVGHEAGAAAVRLDAGGLLGRHDPAALANAKRLLDSVALPALGRFGLMRSMAWAEARRARRKTLPAGWREPLGSLAQSLADSLQGRPSLQSAFIRKHRDLLT